MKNRLFSTIIIVIFILSQGLCACSQEPVPKSSFGEVDALQDGAVLSNGNGDRTGEGQNEDTVQATTSDTPIKTAKSVDVDSLPAGIERMVGMCDAINMACVEMREQYGVDNSDFVWDCVHLYVANCRDKKMGFKAVGDTIEAEPLTISAVVYAMFGKIQELPILSEKMTSDREGIPQVSIGSNLKYRFSRGDRGLSAPEVRRVTQYSDGSLEMEVALVDSSTQEETVSFIYSLRSNTRNTTTSALFEYEITGARSADKITSDKINGLPFLTPVIQVYGYNSYAENESKYNETEEVLVFSSFQEHVPGMEELNDRISKDIIGYTEKEIGEDQWFDVCSYPLTTGDYVQVAVSLAVCPDETSDPDIKVYNYDTKRSRAMDKNDALSFCGLPYDELKKAITSSWEKSEGEEPLGMEYRGFIVRRNGSVDLFCFIDIVDETGRPYKKMIAYNSESKSLRKVFESDGVIPDDEIDNTKPRLTHGRKDKETDG